MNKKASFLGYDLVIWLMRMIILIGMIIIFLMFEGLMFKTNVHVREGEAILMMQSMMTNPNGFSYTSDGRTYPGIIDMERFNPEFLNKSMNLDLDYKNDVHLHDQLRDHWAYHLTLYNSSKKLDEIYYNRYWFEKWRIRANTGLLGSGAAMLLTQDYVVMLRYPDRTETGFLKLEVARPSK